MSIQIGEQAPDFTLYNTEKQKVTLSDQRGKKVVLLFFPLAFTSVCTAELCTVRDTMQQYEALNATIYGISVDSLYTLNKFKKEQQLNFSLLSDFNKEISTRYSCLYDMFAYNMEGVSKRAAFVIDKEGVVQYAEVLDNAGEQPNFTAIQEALSEI